MIKSSDSASSLFEKMTISEIQECEKKTRLEIEKLKEDLRVMVGERYRDLIEAADTIGDMKESVEKISVHVQNMHGHTTKSKNERIIENDKPVTMLNNLNQPHLYYSIATEIKLLVEIPSKIWISIEVGNLLKAAQLYLFAQHVHTNLQFELKQKKDFFDSQFGIITRQWTSVVQFRSFILNHCQDVINSSGMDQQKVAESICALMCLTESSPRKLCSDFLVAKMNELENILTSHLKVANIKDQIAHTISLITETISLVYLIFFPVGNGESLLSKVVKLVADRTQNDLLSQIIPQQTLWAQYIPSSISGFYPTVQMSLNVISEDFLKETCVHWMSTVKEALNNGVSRILSYVNSIKGLSTLQESLENISLSSLQNETWTNACNTFFEREINIWEEFLSVLFANRIKVIINLQIEKMFSQTKTVLDGVFDELSVENSFNESDISGYIWTEEVGDMPVKFTSKDVKKEKDGGKLTMKVKGFTPRIQNVCQNLDASLKLVLDDVGYFVLSCTKLCQALSVNATTELENIKTHLQEACNNLLKRILVFAKGRVTNSNKDHATVLNRALFLARLCTAFGEICINLQKGITGVAINTKEYMHDSFTSIILSGKFLSQKADDNAIWQNVTEMLNEENLAMFNLWRNVIFEEFTRRSQELVVLEDNNLIKYLPRWDTVEIREESEDGVIVNSTISIPMQPSVKLGKLLYWVCLEINKVGGHIIPRSILQSLQCDVMQNILKMYEHYLEDVRKNHRFISQSLSLQMSFDVKFVVGLLSMNSKLTINDQVQLLCDGLESYVDPFDLDVFSPHINNHLKRCIQRSVILLGPITARSSIFHAFRPISSNQQEQHNLLALSSGSRTRFTLLPCGIPSNKPTFPKVEVNENTSEKKLLRNHNVTEKARSASPKRSSTPPPAEISKSASSSFFGAMSSSWFGS